MGFFKFLTTNTVLVLGLIIGFVTITYTSSYTIYDDEQPIAIITFKKIKNQEYLANIYLKNKTHNLITYGDQWRIDAQFKKWKYFADFLGFESKYVIERFEGRYKNINEQNEKKKFSYDLTEQNLLDLFNQDKDKENLFIDTEYGSSVYFNIDEEYVYTVYKTDTSLIMRKAKIDEDIKKDESFFKKFLK